MAFHVVNLRVTAGTPIDCDFWSEDDGWKGVCKTLSIKVNGNSFEDAKKNMATELQGRIERILQCAVTCLDSRLASGAIIEKRLECINRDILSRRWSAFRRYRSRPWSPSQSPRSKPE